jgi:hypothetical protein
MSFRFRASWFTLALHGPAFRPRVLPGGALQPNPQVFYAGKLDHEADRRPRRRVYVVERDHPHRSSERDETPVETSRGKKTR